MKQDSVVKLSFGQDDIGLDYQIVPRGNNL